MNDQGRGPLLARRVPLREVELGRAYVIHARNGGVGIAVREEGRIGYRLRREKLQLRYLFVEWDWEVDARFGTAIPLEPIEEAPPRDDDALLAWLSDMEERHQATGQAAWEEVFAALGTE